MLTENLTKEEDMASESEIIVVPVIEFIQKMRSTAAPVFVRRGGHVTISPPQPLSENFRASHESLVRWKTQEGCDWRILQMTEKRYRWAST